MLDVDTSLSAKMEADRQAVKDGNNTPLQEQAAYMFDNPFSVTKVFNDLGMPIPNFMALIAPADAAEANVPAFFEYWTAIMEWPVT